MRFVPVTFTFERDAQGRVVGLTARQRGYDRPARRTPLPAAPAPAADLALVGATVVDVESGRLLPDHAVLVQANRIVAVQPAGAARPADARVVDAQGK